MNNFCLMAKVLCIVNQSDEWLGGRMPRTTASHEGRRMRARRLPNEH